MNKLLKIFISIYVIIILLFFIILYNNIKFNNFINYSPDKNIKKIYFYDNNIFYKKNKILKKNKEDIFVEIKNYDNVSNIEIKNYIDYCNNINNSYITKDYLNKQIIINIIPEINFKNIFFQQKCENNIDILIKNFKFEKEYNTYIYLSGEIKEIK